jgi:hypothetical protein
VQANRAEYAQASRADATKRVYLPCSVSKTTMQLARLLAGPGILLALAFFNFNEIACRCRVSLAGLQQR